MPRPRKGKELSITVSFSIPGDKRHLLKALDRLAKELGRSRSELIVRGIELVLRFEGGLEGIPELPPGLVEEMELPLALHQMKAKLDRAPRTPEEIRERGVLWLRGYEEHIVPLVKRLAPFYGNNPEFRELASELAKAAKAIADVLIGEETPPPKEMPPNKAARIIKVPAGDLIEGLQGEMPPLEKGVVFQSPIPKPEISLLDAVDAFAWARYFGPSLGRCEFCGADGVVGELVVPMKAGVFRYFVCQKDFDGFIRLYEERHGRKPQIEEVASFSDEA